MFTSILIITSRDELCPISTKLKERKAVLELRFTGIMAVLVCLTCNYPASFTSLTHISSLSD